MGRDPIRRGSALRPKTCLARGSRPPTNHMRATILLLHGGENPLLIFQDLVERRLILPDRTLVGQDGLLIFHDGGLVAENRLLVLYDGGLVARIGGLIRHPLIFGHGRLSKKRRGFCRQPVYTK